LLTKHVGELIIAASRWSESQDFLDNRSKEEVRENVKENEGTVSLVI